MAPDVKVDDIVDILRNRILLGRFGTEGRLPSLRMFAKELGTTQETMNKAIQRLQAEGLLMSLGRKGIFVNMPRARIPGITPRFDLYLKDLGFEPVETNIEQPTIILSPLDVSKVFGVEEGSPVVHRLRRQGTTMSHYRLAENYYPIDLVGGSILESMQKNERFDVLLAIKQTYGKSVKRVHEDVIGRLPLHNESEMLSITRNTPVLEVNRTNFAEDDKTVIMFNRIIFVASYFVLSYDYTVPYWTSKT